MSIKEVITKIKTFWQTDGEVKNKLLTIIAIFLVGTSSFGLGRLSVYEEKKESVTIEMPKKVLMNSNDSVVKNNKEQTGVVLGEDLNLKEGGGVVASKTGGKYHFPWCAGAKRILESNRIYFKSAGEARAAGFLPAGNCKGLE